jgi:arylsulfatase
MLLLHASRRAAIAIIGLLGSMGLCYAQASALSTAVARNPTMQPSVPLPAQEQAANLKLEQLLAAKGRRPNILWLVIDDMGWGDPGVYGGGSAIGAATPAIDKLAHEGIQLTSAYSQPTCTPTRSAILTGRLPVRTGLTRPILAGDTLSKNPWADEVSLPRLLSESGYRTVLSGKWHVGELPGMRPYEVGFDEFYGYYAAEKEITQQFDERRYPDLVLDPEKLAAYRRIGASDSLVHALKDGTETVVRETKGIEDIAESDGMLKDFTIQKIKEFAGGTQPFFLEHAFMKVHADTFPAKAFKGKSASKFQYKDSVVEVDAYIGEIVQALADTGQLENTFIFITSDNGPQMDSWPDSGFTPFRGAKGTTWEGGVRVPGIAYWKGMITPGQVSDDLFDLMDLFNTSLAIAGAADKIPTDRYIDGIDQTPFLLADNGKSARDKVFMWNERTLMAMRMKEYKIHLKVLNAEQLNLNIDMSTIADVGLAPWIFNLYIDPKESYTVGHRLNAWTASLAAEMKGHAATFRKFPPKDIGLGQ